MKAPAWLKKGCEKIGDNGDKIVEYGGSSAIGGLQGWMWTEFVRWNHIWYLADNIRWEEYLKFKYASQDVGLWGAVAGAAGGVLAMKYGPSLLKKSYNTYRIAEKKLVSHFIKKYAKTSTELETKNSEQIPKQKKERNRSHVGCAAGLVVNSPLVGPTSMLYYAYTSTMDMPKHLTDLGVKLTRTSLFFNAGIQTAMHEYFHAITDGTLFDSTLNYTLDYNIFSQDGSFIKTMHGPALWDPRPEIYISNWKELLENFKKDNLFGSQMRLSQPFAYDYRKFDSLFNLLTGKYNGGGHFRFFNPSSVDCILEADNETIKELTPHYRMTALGSVLGENNSDLLLVAAGTVGEIGASLLLYLIGRKIKDRKPLLGSFMQTFSLGLNLNSIWYPVNSAVAYLKGGWYSGDWTYIYQRVNIDPMVMAGALSAIYPATVLGLYLKDRRDRKNRERREALHRLISDGTIRKDDVNQMLKNYADQSDPNSKILGGVPFRLPLMDMVSKLRMKKRKNELLRYRIDRFDDFSTNENRLMEEFKCGGGLIKTLKLRRHIKKLRSVRDKAMNAFIKDGRLKTLVDKERELYGILCDNYFEFDKKPEEACKNIQERSNVTDDLEGLKRRLENFYDGDSNIKSAASVIYGKS